MEQDYIFIGILVLAAALLPIAGLGTAAILRPKRPNPLKQTTYECGIETIGDTWVQFKVSYYIYALVFVIFDVEAIFLLPIAVALNQVSFYALLWAIVFIILLADGLVYAWRKGALDWI